MAGSGEAHPEVLGRGAEQDEHLASLLASIETFVDANLPDLSTLERVRAAKAIHDPIWGTSVFSPVEIAVMDTPLVQRLRGVHQTSLAYLVYPAATHTRFEHSLGVSVVADRLMDALAADHRVRTKYANLKFGPDTPERLTVRLSALLHDVGHSFLSHIGEQQRGDHQWLESLRDTDRAMLDGAKPHELLSYLIVKSNSFKCLWEKMLELYAPLDPRLHSVKLDEVAEFIIGHALPDRRHLADIINGCFDADKLDYLFRDAYSTGLRLTFDIDRLLYAMTLEVVDEEWLRAEPRPPREKRRTLTTELGPDCGLRLVVRASGVSALEQILFCKMQLVVCIYQHQKVRASDAMLSRYVEYIDGEEVGEHVISLHDPVDFLSFTDWQWLYEDCDNEYLQKIATSVRNRTVMKRALVLSRETSESGLNDLISWGEEPVWDEIHDELRTGIIEELSASMPNHGLTKYDVRIDLPGTPSFREAAQTPILLPDESLDTLSSFFPTSSWLSTFFAHKWNGHVFCDGSLELRQRVADAAIKVLGEHPDIKLQLNEFAKKLAHVVE